MIEKDKQNRKRETAKNESNARRGKRQPAPSGSAGRLRDHRAFVSVLLFLCFLWRVLVSAPASAASGRPCGAAARSALPPTCIHKHTPQIQILF